MRYARREGGRGAAAVAPCVALTLCAALAPPLHAQSELDVEPPLIEHEIVESGVAGEPQEFRATVVDDRALEEVLLFHRRADEETFVRLPMRRVASSTTFTATVETEAGDERAIEYYLQARDEAGNRVIKGYAFSPLVRAMGAGGTSAGRGDVGEDAPRRGRTWLLVGLGVVAAGIAIALADTDEPADDIFTVTISPPR